MLVAARMTAWAKRGGRVPTARNYVQDGLIAMWDGIENAGWGVHDPNATVWKDLAGMRDLTVRTEIAMFDVDCLKAHSIPSDSGITIAPAYSENILPANENLEFEIVFGVHNQISDDYSVNIFTGGGASTVDSTRARNVVLVQYLTQYNRHFCCSTTSVKALPYNNESTMLSAGTHSYSSGEVRSRPLFDGKVVSGASAFDAFPLTQNDLPLTIGGIKFQVLSTMPVGDYICNLRIYSRHLTMQERLSNYAIDKARFNLP